MVSLDVIAATPFDRNESASRLIDSETEVALASSFEVSSRAAVLLADGTTSREIRDSTSVSSVLDATVINVSYTAVSEADARGVLTLLLQRICNIGPTKHSRKSTPSPARSRTSSNRTPSSSPR